MKDIFLGVVASVALYLFFGWVSARDEIHELREVARLSCQVHPTHLVIGQLERASGSPRATCDYIERRDSSIVNVKGTL